MRCLRVALVMPRRFPAGRERCSQQGRGPRALGAGSRGGARGAGHGRAHATAVPRQAEEFHTLVQAFLGRLCESEKALKYGVFPEEEAAVQECQSQLQVSARAGDPAAGLRRATRGACGLLTLCPRSPGWALALEWGRVGRQYPGRGLAPSQIPGDGHSHRPQATVSPGPGGQTPELGAFSVPSEHGALSLAWGRLTHSTPGYGSPQAGGETEAGWHRGHRALLRARRS